MTLLAIPDSFVRRRVALVAAWARARKRDRRQFSDKFIWFLIGAASVLYLEVGIGFVIISARWLVGPGWRIW